MQIFVLLLGAFGAAAARHTLRTQFKDSAIIVDTDKPLPTQTATLPYYQPVQNLPIYSIMNSKPINQAESISTSTVTASNSADIFTQEEFPRDLLEIAQHKLGLKSLNEVPSITELAELLGTNTAAETISYIRQLTSTDQGIALMRAYIESSDYTDSAGSKEKQISTTLAPKTTTAAPIQNQTEPGFLDRMTAYLNIYNVQPQHQQAMEQQFKKIVSAPHFKPSPLKNMRPLYVQNPLPYHYPIPLRPHSINRTALRKSYGRPIAMAPVAHSAPHLNTSKVLTPAYIQQLARIANVSPHKLASFLQQKPKLAELAAKMVRFPSAQERNPLADSQLMAAVRKVIEQDEDLKKLIAANTLM